MGPDRNKLLRNFAILILLAVAAWRLPGGGTATLTANNILGLLALALVVTSRLWSEGGLGVLLWLALIGAGAYGCVTVYRASREY